jgi:hypothetical protein
MTRTGSPRHSITHLVRRLSIGHGHARRRNAPGNRFVDQSPLRDASFGYRNRPTEFATPSTAAYSSGQRTWATNPHRRNPHSV